MIPSLVNRISKTLSFSQSGTSSSGQSSKQKGSMDGSGSLRKTNSTASSDGTMGTLRRQSTRQLISEEESTSGSKITGKSSITKIRTSSIVREVSKTRSSSVTLLNSRQMSKRLSKAPSRLVEEDEASLRREPSLAKSPSKSLTKSPSVQVTKASSLSRSTSQGSMKKKTSISSVKGTPPVKEKKERPGGKQLWFTSGAFLTVRNEEGGFYLCRAINNIYNTSKMAKVRWLGPKTGRKIKRGRRSRAQSALPVMDNAYELMYQDEVDPATVLMEVDLERRGKTFMLSDVDKEETERLMHVAEDVETGKMNKDDIGDDVEEAIQIDYEPPVKRRKLQAGTSPASRPKADKTATKEKKPRLKKTLSQKEREKAKKAKEREEKRQKKKEAAGERKRKRPIKEDDTALHPNPAVKIMEKDPLWETNVHMPYVSKFSNSKLAFRAVQLNDMKLLKKLLKDSERIHSLNHNRNTIVMETPLVFAMKQGNKEATNLLMEDAFGNKFSARERDSHPDRLMIGKLGTGTYNYRSLGVGRIRPLMASRGAREGNNALLKDRGDHDGYNSSELSDFFERSLLAGANKELLFKILNGGEDLKTELEDLSIEYSEENAFITNLPTMLARGFNQQAGEILKLLPHSRQLSHMPKSVWKVLVAKDVSELPSIPPSAINLGIRKLKGFSMIHVAASNPNPQVLEKVLGSDPNFLVSDVKGMRPIHIAAGCSSTETLQLLLDKGANPYDADNEGRTALHFAILAGRTKNVEILLKLITDSKARFVDPTAGRPNGGVNRMNKESQSPLHIACEKGQLDIVKLLVKHGANLNAKTSINNLSVTPLMFAAGAGHLNIVRCLVDAGAIVEFRDRVGRTALMHAAMNGSTSVMSYLLHIGASPNRKDTSGNTPLHYAAGYGWYFAVKLLLDSGADPSQSNDWTTTPLSVAYLKSHQGIVSLLLEDDRVDVNFPNAEGETLLFIACSCEKEEYLLEQVQYLIEEKGADCTLVNSSGQTVLHYLAQTRVYTSDFYEDKDKQKIYKEAIVDKVASKVVFEITEMLVERGCDVTLPDKNGFTAAMLALREGNLKLAQYLVELGSPIYASVSEKDGPLDTVLHHVASNMMHPEGGNPNDVITFLTSSWTVKGEKKTFQKELYEMAQTFDRVGDTPLLKACISYSRGSFSENMTVVKRETSVWTNAFDFIENLINVARSDVNVYNKPRWMPLGAQKPDETNRLDYCNSSQAKWTPLFHMVEANDPYFDKHRKFDSTKKGRGLKFLLTKGARANVYDLCGHTPLTYAVAAGKDVAILQLLINEGYADINKCKLETVSVRENDETKTVTYKIPPLCLAVRSRRYGHMEKMIEWGASVDSIDEREQESVLHILAEQRSVQGTLAAMEKVIEAGAKVNPLNKSSRTPFHVLVNKNKGNIDDSFEEEILLLGKKADLSIHDNLGRIPLHYVFTKYSDHWNMSQDPVDLCKLLVKSMKPADLNIADKDGCTALHYAAKHGASICCMYLLQKGVDLNLKDKDGNTALAHAVRARQDSCGSVLIQHGADLKSPVVLSTGHEQPATKDKLPPEWKWKPLAVEEEKVETEQKVHLFQEAIKNGLVGVSFLILEWPVEKSGITLVDAIEMAVKNSQFNVALRLLSTTIKGSAEVCAVREQKRNLLHVLAVSANPSRDQHLQTKDLLSVLQNNPSRSPASVAQTLIDKGVPANAKDKFNCTPLFHAAYNGNWYLARFFAELPGVMDVKAVDSFRRNLVGASMWKSCVSGTQYVNGTHYDLWDWLATLMGKKVDINKTFDFPMILDVFGSKESMGNRPHPDYLQHYPGCQTTALIFALHYKDFNFIKNLLVFGANPNLTDGDSLTPLIHAVKRNAVAQVKQLLKYDYCPSVDDREPVQPQSKRKKKKQPVKKRRFVLKQIVSSSDSESESSEEEEETARLAPKKPNTYYPVKKTSSVNLNATDSRGWTALHYAACPLELGSFDNEEIVFVLGKAGAKLDVKNTNGQTPLDLALASGSPKVAAMLQTLMGIDKNVQKQPVFPPVDHRVDDGVDRRSSYDFHSDADKQTAGGEEEMEEDEAFEPGVSPYCNITNGTIARDEDQDLPYEVLMTKCDAHLGVWGLYNFYQIQLVHQPGQNLYVLFTRWGRIGDSGQYQHTPYSSKEDGVKEFCKIFRQKSGNKWEDVKNFEQKPKKYRLVPVEDRRPPQKQKEVKFDFSTKTKCTLRADVRKAMEIMTNVEKLQNAYRRDINIDTDVLPFGRFNRERLLQAKLLLEDMSVFVNNIAEYRKDGKDRTAEEKEQHQEDCQKVSQLSSEYFQLIPQKNFVYEQLRPLDQLRDFQKQFKLITNLLDFEVSTKMMLGAMYRKTDVHPLDYVYSVMKCKLELMEEEDPMIQCILRYAQIGSNNRHRFEAVYKVEREGENVRFQKCGLDNHRLLWHGTSTSNLTSILNRGLISMPLDASLTGDRFGKGIYFADLFCKSDNYADSNSKTSNFMLLCEVALGKQRHIDDFDTVNKRCDDYNSSVALGRTVPDPNYDIRLPSGEVMSMGDSTHQYTYVGADGEEHRRSACHTEYIVYHENQVCIRYLLQYRLR